MYFLKQGNWARRGQKETWQVGLCQDQSFLLKKKKSIVNDAFHKGNNVPKLSSVEVYQPLLKSFAYTCGFSISQLPTIYTSQAACRGLLQQLEQCLRTSPADANSPLIRAEGHTNRRSQEGDMGMGNEPATSRSRDHSSLAYGYTLQTQALWMSLFLVPYKPSPSALPSSLPSPCSEVLALALAPHTLVSQYPNLSWFFLLSVAVR